MNPILRAFVAERCIQNSAAVTQLRELLDVFRATLPAKARASWPRDRVISELSRAGFKVGLIDKTAHVAGLALRGQWQEVDGRLELSTNG